MISLLLLAACIADPGAPAVYTVTGPESPPFADPDTQAEVTVRLAGMDAFAQRDAWPKVTLTLSSGTWVGETDATLERDLAEAELTAWFNPDRLHADVVIETVLAYGEGEWREDLEVALCPAELGTVDLRAEAASVALDSAVTLTFEVRTPSGGVPSPGTWVGFTVATVGTGVVATLDRTSAPVDDDGNVSVELFASGAAGAVTVEGTATRPAWEGCAEGDPRTTAVQVLVTESAG